MKKFDENKFTLWRQDNFDGTKINTIDEYLGWISNLGIEYCIKELNYTPHQAYNVIDKLIIQEEKRLRN